MDQSKRLSEKEIKDSFARHFDPRKTGRDQFDPGITYTPDYKPSARTALAEEKRRFESNKNKQTFK